MNTPNEDNCRDALGYLVTLQDVLRHPALFAFRDGGPITPEAESVALLLAEALGYCRLFGIEPPAERDGTLPASVALAAARRMQDVITDAMEESEELPRRWEAARSQLEMDMLCSDLLHTRMNAWAVLVAVDEASLAALERRQADSSRLDSATEMLGAAIAHFDTALRRDEELLSTVCDLHLLNNWRSMLAEPYALALPWWLDGSLERAAAEIEGRANIPLTSSLSSGKTEGVRLSPSLHRLFHDFRSIPTASALAAAGQAVRPHRGKREWSSEPDANGYLATLAIPFSRDAGGETRLVVRFSARTDADKARLHADLVDKPASLGAGRAIIRARELPSVPGEPVLEAFFVLEQIDAGTHGLELRVDGRPWFPVIPREDAP